MGWALLDGLSCPPVLQRTWIMQFGFSNYPLILVGLVPDPVSWLSANYFEPGKNSEVIFPIQHDLSDLEPMQGGPVRQGRWKEFLVRVWVGTAQ
jgi:hypothetical protein